MTGFLSQFKYNDDRLVPVREVVDNVFSNK